MQTSKKEIDVPVITPDHGEELLVVSVRPCLQIIQRMRRMYNLVLEKSRYMIANL